MKRLIFKTISPLLAMLVLLSTVSWTVDKHLCMGRVMDVAFFSHAEDCGMEAAMEAFEKSNNHCCDDESFTMDGQDDLKFPGDDFEIEHQEFLVALASAYFKFNFIQTTKVNLEEIYPPPLLVQDLNMLHEVYLI